MLLLRFNSTGDLLDKRLFGGAHFESATALAVDPAGSVLLVGSASQYSAGAVAFDGMIFIGGTFDMLAIKVNFTGSRIWSRLIGSASLDQGTGVGVNLAGGVYVGGFTLKTKQRVSAVQTQEGKHMRVPSSQAQA